MNNIFEREDVSFHGLRSFDFLKLKSILEVGIFPNELVPEHLRNSEFDGENAKKVFMTISPKILGPFRCRAYSWYVRNSLGIVVNKKLENAPNNSAFRDGGYFYGRVDPELFIGITIPKEIYESNVSSLREQGVRIHVDDNLGDVPINDIIDEYNTRLLPIYDSDSRELLKDYDLNNNDKHGKMLG